MIPNWHICIAFVCVNAVLGKVNHMNSVSAIGNKAKQLKLERYCLPFFPADITISAYWHKGSIRLCYVLECFKISQKREHAIYISRKYTAFVNNFSFHPYSPTNHGFRFFPLCVVCDFRKSDLEPIRINHCFSFSVSRL